MHMDDITCNDKRKAYSKWNRYQLYKRTVSLKNVIKKSALKHL